MTPLLIFLGFTPAQAVSTGKFNGLAISLGTLTGMRSKRGLVSRRKVIPIMVLSLAVGLVAPFFITHLESSLYRVIMGVVLLLMIPVMVFKKIGVVTRKPTMSRKLGGGVLLSLALLMQGIFSGGLGTMVNVVLMGMLGMTATEANLTKRWSQLILNITVLLGVIGTGLVYWPVLMVGVPAMLAGGYLGGRLAVKKGDKFIMNMLIALMVVSALGLILGFGA
jgi:uncharacterized membrane protein YfcA